MAFTINQVPRLAQTYIDVLDIRAYTQQKQNT